jgi:hypothetical protein
VHVMAMLFSCLAGRRDCRRVELQGREICRLATVMVHTHTHTLTHSHSAAGAAAVITPPACSCSQHGVAHQRGTHCLRRRDRAGWRGTRLRQAGAGVNAEGWCRPQCL